MLEEVESHPYLGVVLDNKMRWSPYIGVITSRANNVYDYSNAVCGTVQSE